MFILVILTILRIQTKRKVLIALPTIDRDFCFVEIFYNHLMKSIPESSNFEFTILTVMREQDTKMYNFWKDKSIIKKVKNYEILKDRHNLEKVSETFNYIKNYASQENYDNLIIIESDIMLKLDTITKLLKNLSHSDIVVFPFETPWAGFPVVLNQEQKYINFRDVNEDQYIKGHGTGCIIMNKEVIEDEKINFNVEKHGTIIGQDIGFFKSLHENNYKVFMINDELYHAYKHIQELNN